MKRTLSLLLVLAMLMGVPGFADTGQTGAEALKQYGFIVGSNGDLMVEKPLTRAQACVLLAEIYGEKTQVSGTAYQAKFTDVKKGDWFAGYVLHAQSRGWVSGYPDGSFKPSATIKVQEWAVMLMKALGYNFTWDTAVDDLLTLGIEIKAVNINALTRGESFEALWKAINTPRAGRTEVLGVELGKLPKAPEPPKAPSISAHTITSLKQVALVSSHPLNAISATKLQNFEVSAVGIPSLSVSHVAYDAATNRIVLTLNTAVPQQTTIAVKINGLISSEGVEIGKDTVLNILMLDVTQPTIVKAEVIGARTIKVQFSEPIKSTNDRLPNADFAINNGSVLVKEIILQNNQTMAYIETYVDLTGTVKLLPKDTLKDHFNFSVTSSEISLSVTKDTTLPYVTGYEGLTATGITLVFNEDIKVFNGLSSQFYHGVPSNIADTSVTSAHVNGNKLRLSFSKNFIPTGTTTVWVASGAITDYSGNKNTLGQVQISLAADAIKPTVVGNVQAITEKRVRIQFSEPMMNKNGEAQSRNNIKLTDVSNNDQSAKIASINYSVDSNSLDIQFIENLSGSYVLKLNNQKDYSGNSLEVTDYLFVMKDLTAPNPLKWSVRLYNSGLTNQMVKIRFDEAMAVEGQYSVLDPGKYFINGKSLDKLDLNLLRIVAVNDNTAVEIHYPGSIIASGVTFFADTNTTAAKADDIEIGRVADAAGNYIDTLSTVIDLESKGSLSIEKATHVRADAIEVIVSDILVSVAPSDFRVESSGKAYMVVGYDFDVLPGQKTKLTLKLSEGITGSSSLTTLKVVGQGSVNSYGEALDLGAAARTLADGMAPYVISSSFDGTLLPYITYTRSTGTVLVRFSEEIDPRTVSLLSFGVSNYGIQDILVSGTDISIVISAADRNFVSVFDSVLQKVEVRDKSGNGVVNLNLQIQKIY